MAIFMGPDAYIIPSWYTSRQKHGKVVPTWNYVAVHAYGPVEFFDDPDRLLDVVTRLTNLHEASREKPWAVTDAPEDFIRAMLRGIIGLRLPITCLEGKRKMSQNRSAEDRAGVAAALATSENAADRAAAALIPDPERSASLGCRCRGTGSRIGRETTLLPRALEPFRDRRGSQI